MAIFPKLVPTRGELRCFCNFPAEYRNEFYHMVAQLGELRYLACFG